MAKIYGIVSTKGGPSEKNNRAEESLPQKTRTKSPALAGDDSTHALINIHADEFNEQMGSDPKTTSATLPQPCPPLQPTSKKPLLAPPFSWRFDDRSV
ncbi:MAG: hypothetical protein GXP08_00955 [Gammaproteobacteria bacterium]|nr:hypothetical protein [Gammaproteobacteria bacterium]